MERLRNWLYTERGLGVLMPKAREAYRTFAIHSCDTETGYRRDESWETKTFRIGDWNETEAQALWAEFDKVEKAPAEIEKGCTNKGLPVFIVMVKMMPIFGISIFGT